MGAMERMIDEREFTVAMKEAVAERGVTYRYPKTWRDDDGNCRYFHDNGAPACLIGTALAKLGYTHEFLLEGESAHPALTRLGAPEAVCFAAFDAQQVQDQGGTWGDALDRYTDTLTEPQKGAVL